MAPKYTIIDEYDLKNMQIDDKIKMDLIYANV
jgi:hypothetical protein